MCTSRVWPMRWHRSCACASIAGFQSARTHTRKGARQRGSLLGGGQGQAARGGPGWGVARKRGWALEGAVACATLCARTKEEAARASSTAALEHAPES